MSSSSSSTSSSTEAEVALVLLNVSNALQLLSFIFTNMIYLRAVSISSSVVFLFYTWYAMSSLTQKEADSNYAWSSLMIALNLGQLMILWFRYYCMELEDDAIQSIHRETRKAHLQDRI